MRSQINIIALSAMVLPLLLSRTNTGRLDTPPSGVKKGTYVSGFTDRGPQWISWSPKQREIYANGFIAGYANGSHGTCLELNKLVTAPEQNSRNSLETRCNQGVETFSKPPSYYAEVLTDFYTGHPEYIGVPFFYLMSVQSDSQHKTVHDLYQMGQKGELPTGGPLR